VSADRGAVAAAVLYEGVMGLLFGVRTWQHRRATGRSGFAGFTAGRRGWGRFGETGFGAAVLAGAVSPLLAATGRLPLLHVQGPAGAGLRLAGAGVAVAGLGLAWVAQSAMGTSWRIGVDETEKSALVTDGIFATVRNPVFTAMIAAQAGTALLAPTWLSVTGVGLLVAACQVQVRGVEEPYLMRRHGSRYLSYAARTGRFLPGLGGLHPAQRPVVGPV